MIIHVSAANFHGTYGEFATDAMKFILSVLRGGRNDILIGTRAKNASTPKFHYYRAVLQRGYAVRDDKDG